MIFAGRGGRSVFLAGAEGMKTAIDKKIPRSRINFLIMQRLNCTLEGPVDERGDARSKRNPPGSTSEKATTRPDPVITSTNRFRDGLRVATSVLNHNRLSFKRVSAISPRRLQSRRKSLGDNSIAECADAPLPARSH